MNQHIHPVLAADIGGTNMRAAIVNPEGNILEKTLSRTALGERNISESQLIDRLVSFLSSILKNDPSIKAVGIGFPGFFLGDSGTLISSPNLPGLHNVDLAKNLTELLSLPVSIQNDGLCAAMGEHHYGAGKGTKNLLHITLGTGIGAGLILNNAPYSGESGMAMEFGHLRVSYSESSRACGCGGHGCVEAYASASSIEARYFESSGLQCDAREVYERAKNQDVHAIKVIGSAGHYLGMAMAEAIKLLDIHTITISGGLTGAWSILHPNIIAGMNQYLIPPLQGKVHVLKSTLDDHAGLLGAAAMASS